MSSDLPSIESQFNINSDKPNDDRIYEFENFRLDAAHLMLYENKTAVSLAPKVVETLLALVERSGEIVSKKDLMNRLWADSFVEEANLTQYIYLLRKTLGKAADGRDLIETLRRRGYRFTGEIKQAKSDLPENSFAAVRETPPQIIREKSFRHWNLWYLTAAAAVLLVAGFGLTRFDWREKETAQIPRDSHITLKPLTPKATTFNPAISPDGEYVAYSKLENEGTNSLWLQNLQTGEARELLPPFVKGYSGLQFSPDGKKIFYLSYRETQPNYILAEVELESGATREVLQNVSVWFAVSPDGTKAAFVRDTDLIVADTNGGAERAIAKRDGKSKWFASQNAQPAWSPDGKRIVVSGGFAEQNVKYPELVEISVGDGTEKRIQTPPWDKIGSVAWTRDDSGLYVIAREEPNQPAQIFFLSQQNGAVRKVTGDLHNYNSLSLTADSRFLVAEQVAGKSDIWLAAKDNLSQIERLTFADEENIGVNGLAFMPDGRIVYTSPRSGNFDLWIMNPDGSDQKQLTSNMSGWNIRPRPSPDGRYIVFQSFHNNQNHIWRMDADGRNVIQLTDGDANCSSPDITPDGQWIYYTSTIGDQISIWKISINGGAAIRFSGDERISRPSVSPDGKLIAVHYEWDPKASSKVGIVSTETGKKLKTFEIEAFRRIVRWTPDSKSLIYIQKNSSNLRQQPIDGGAPRQLTDFNLEQIWNFDFSADHQRMVLARGSINTESVLIGNLK